MSSSGLSRGSFTYDFKDSTLRKETTFKLNKYFRGTKGLYIYNMCSCHLSGKN